MPQSVPLPYLGEEESPHGTVAYLYAFKYLADNTNFFFTNHTANVTVTNLPATIGPATTVFTSAQVGHTGRQASQEFEGQGFDVLVRVYEDRLAASFHTAAAGQIKVAVIRVAQGILGDVSPTVDFTQHCLLTQSGLVTSVSLSGQQAVAKVVPEIYLFDRQIPRNWFQRTCNHQLYHALTCKVLAASFNYATTITALDRVTRRMTVSGQRPASGADFFNAGYLTHTVTGGTFGIEISEFVSSNTRFTMRTWSPEFAIGQALVAFAGCRRTTADCLSKFNNLANFGGFGYIPEKNPALHGI